MAINDDIRLVKGAYDVTLFTTLPTEDLVNAIQFVPPVQTPGNAAQGPLRPKALDLLKITETFLFRCYITKTDSISAKQVKLNLKKLAKGADIDGGGPITLYYEDEQYPVYITKLTIKKINNDNAISNYAGTDSAEYDVSLTLTIAEDVA